MAEKMLLVLHIAKKLLLMEGVDVVQENMLLMLRCGVLQCVNRVHLIHLL
jgi:hypothetical protein